MAERMSESLKLLGGAAFDQFERTKRLLTSAVGRIAIFLFVAMPLVFYSCMAVGGWMMSYLADWKYERGFDFMASAITGGAIVFPADPPQRFLSKVFASSAASGGIGIFGFTVALLSNSLVDPLVKVLGLEVEASELQEAANVNLGTEHASDSLRQIVKIIGKLGILATVFMVANITGAALFGSVLGYMQGWDTWTGFKTMASVELGGGVQFHGMGTVTAEGQLVYVTVGVWSIGMATLMVAIAGAPGSQIVGQALGIKFESASGSTPRSKAWAASKTLIFLVFIVLPCTLLLVMFAVACIMGPLTTWSFKGAFWAALPAVSGGAAALSSNTNPPLTAVGAIILICAASAGFFVLSLMIGLGGEMLSPIIMHPIFEPYLGRERSVGHSVLALVGISAVLIPTLVFCGSIFVGAFMALVQDWPFFEGFWWCVAVQLGGGMALSSETVNSFAGMLFGAICVAWSIGVSILAIGVSGAPVVVPLMDALGMTIDPEELQSIADSMRTKNTAA
jgi:hypothetical protein